MAKKKRIKKKEDIDKRVDDFAEEVEELAKRAKKAASGPRRLYRSGRDKILGGVCGGIGEYLGVDPVIIRLLWIVATFAWGTGVLAYIIAWIIIPEEK